jgi:cytolysin (calcineurin-like family phosphatase)
MTSGGLPIGDPIGVVLSGDLSNDGDQYQLDIFREYWEPGRKRSDLPQAERDRTEVSGFAQPIEQMKFAYWLGFGNHDAAQSPDASGRDRWVNFTKSRLGYQCANKASYEDNYGSYSWDWGNLHLVQLNTLGFFVNGGDHHYEVDAWLKQDLLDHASDGRPVILFQHYAFTGKDSLDFWPAAYHEDYLNAIKGYNVIAIFAGHDHEPAIDTSTGYTLYRGSTGGDHSNFTPSGVFAVHVTNDYLDVAFYEWCSHGTPTKCEAGKSCAVARCASADVDPAPAVPPVQYNPVYSQHRYIGR